jgi:hypothetical protein
MSTTNKTRMSSVSFVGIGIMLLGVGLMGMVLSDLIVYGWELRRPESMILRLIAGIGLLIIGNAVRRLGRDGFDSRNSDSDYGGSDFSSETVDGD